MPKPDAATLARREEIVADMRVIVPGEGVVDAVNSMRAFESDGLTAYRQLPLVVVLPETTAQVSRILKYCSDRNIRVVPRGSGTSLSGGALPLEDAVLLVMSRFNRILDIDYAEPGGRRPAGRHQSRHHQGGRGGRLLLCPRSLLADRLFDRRQCGREFRRRSLPQIRADRQQRAGRRDGADDGEVVRLGGKHLDAEGYDLLGLMTGSEGCSASSPR
jgi:glycolate oxidase